MTERRHTNKWTIDPKAVRSLPDDHPDIKEIPVILAPAERIETRAESFVSHNRDRVAMTPAQVFYGEVGAGVGEAVNVLRIVEDCGASIPRYPVAIRQAKPGQITAVGDARKCFTYCGEETLARVLRIAVEARMAPISQTVVRALRMILTDSLFEEVAALSDSEIAGALAGIENFERAAHNKSAEIDQGRYYAAALLIANNTSAWRKAASA